MFKKSIPDQQLVIDAMNNSQDAYFGIYMRYYPAVRANIAKIIHNSEDVDDLCMESFEKVFRTLRTYDFKKKFSTWVITIAKNAALDAMYKEITRKKCIEGIQVVSDELIEDSDSNIDKIPSIEEIREAVFSAICEMPIIYQEVSRLCFLCNLSYQEIVEETGLQIGTVKTRVRRAKALLSNNIRKMYSE